MTKRIKDTGSKQPLIRDTSKPQPRIDPDVVAKALGAERVASISTDVPPHEMVGLHHRLFLALRSSGGRPGLVGTELRPKIPMTVEDWNQLEQLARDLANEQGFAPTPGQVGSQLLHDALANLRVGSKRVPAGTSAVQPTRASEPAAAYSTRPVPAPAAVSSTPPSALQARRLHLEQAQATSEQRAA